MLASAATDGTESALKPEVASSLSTFGLTFVVGTFSQIADAGKSSVKPDDAAVIGKNATELVDRYRAEVRNGAFAANLLYATGDVAITGGQVMGSGALATAAPSAAVATIARYGNEKLRNYIVDDTVARAAAVLSTGIDAMSADDQKHFDQLLSDGKFDQAAAQFEQSTGKLSAIKQSFGSEAQPKAIMDKAIQSALAKGSSAAIKLAGAAYEKATDLEADFTNHVKGINAFTAEAAEKFRALDDGLKVVRTQLDDVKGQINNIEKDQATTERQVAAIQDILFDEQPPSVKLALLDSGAKSALTDAQRATLRTALITQVKQQQLVQTASNIVGYARDVRTILTNIGVNDPALNKAVQYGSIATAAVSQVFSGNYLGALASISGLFGGGQDPIQQQFQQVFAQLANLDKKLDEVIQLQEETLTAIETLSRQLADVDQRLEHRFDRLDFEVARLNAGVEQAIWNDVNGCESAWRNRSYYSGYDELEKRFTTYRSMELYTNSFGDRAYTCQTTLIKLYDGMRSQKFAGNPIALDLVSAELSKNMGVPDEVNDGQYGKSALERYRTELHQPAFDLVRLSWEAHQVVNPAWGSLATAYAMLNVPSATASDLRSRIEFLNKIDSSRGLRPCTVKGSFVGTRLKTYLCTDGARYDEVNDQDNDERARKTATAFLKTPIVRDQVSVLTNYAALVAGPSDIAAGASSPGTRSLDTILKDSRASRGREVITGAMMVSDVSIAQQAMIYGDLTAWFIVEQLWDPTAKRFRSAPVSDAYKARFELAKKLLTNANNPWLQRNVLMLILQSTEKPCRSGATATPCENPAFLYELAYDQFFPTKGDEGEHVVLIEPASDAVAAAKVWLSGLFDIHSDVTFETSDVVDGLPAARRVLLKLDGYALQLPTPKDWSTKAFVYPPLMRERLADTLVLAQRLADYTVFDDMDEDTKVSLVRIAAKGVQ